MRMITKLAVTSVLLTTAWASHGATTVTVGNRLNNSGFGTPLSNLDQRWFIVGGSAGTRGVNNAINADTVEGTDEGESFDRFFDSGAFAVLGDSAGAIGGAPGSGLSSMTQEFRAPRLVGGQQVVSLSLDLSFDFAFDGIADPGAQTTAPFDSFSVTLQRVRPNAADPVTLMTETLGVSRLGQISGHFSQTLTDLVPGSFYWLTFSLFEDNLQIADFPVQAFNSAVGIDNVRIQGTATVVPIPPAAFLLASAMGAMTLFPRRRIGMTV